MNAPSEASNVADRVLHAKIPHNLVYRNFALLQAANPGEGHLDIGTRIDGERARLIGILSNVPSEYFAAHRWPAIANHFRIPVPTLSPTQEIPFRILDELQATRHEGIWINENFVPTVSTIARTLAERDREDSMAYMGPGIDVIETAIVTGVNGVISRKHDLTPLPVTLGEERTKEFGAIIQASVREVARRLGIEDMLFPES